MITITLSGVDGSGKSTQLEMLKEKLTSQGKKVAYFHAVEFSLANRLARMIKGQKEFQPGKEKANTKGNWFSLHTRIKFLFLDMMRFWFFRKKLEREGYDYLISDRFFYDSIINILYLSQGISFFRWTLALGARILTKLTPRADKAFYFDISPDSILSRERVPEQGREYLSKKIELFKEKVPLWNMQEVNALQDKETLSHEIYEAVAK